MQDLIVSALATRNFRLDRSDVVSMTVMVSASELTSESNGSCGRPIHHKLSAGKKQNTL